MIASALDPHAGVDNAPRPKPSKPLLAALHGWQQAWNRLTTTKPLAAAMA